VIKAAANDDERLGTDILDIFVAQGQRLAPDDPFAHIKVRGQRGNDGKRLTSAINSGEFLSAIAPFGCYLVWATVVDQHGEEGSSQKQTLNYVFQTDFRPLEDVLDLHAEDSFLTLASGGLEMRNGSGSGGRISATLRQPFRSGIDLTIMGSVTFATLLPGTESPGLDINIGFKQGGTYVERIASIFPDGPDDKCALKLAGEGRRSPRVLNDDVGQEFRVIPDGKTPHFFVLRIFQKSDAISRCELFLGHSQLNPLLESPIHARDFPTSLLANGLTWIQIRLWKRGVVRFYRLTVFENIAS